MMQKTNPLLAAVVLVMAVSAGNSQAATFRGFELLPRAVGESVGDMAGGSASLIATGEVGSDASAAHSSEADDRLRRADTHFNTGRQLYFQSDMTGARREFDVAVDVLLTASESLPDHRRIERRLDELSDLIYRFDVEKLGAGQPQQEAAVVFDRAPIDEISHMTFPVDVKLTPKLSLELKQTTSGIPLELSDPVLSYVHYFSTDYGVAFSSPACAVRDGIES